MHQDSSCWTNQSDSWIVSLSPILVFSTILSPKMPVPVRVQLFRASDTGTRLSNTLSSPDWFHEWSFPYASCFFWRGENKHSRVRLRQVLRKVETSITFFFTRNAPISFLPHEYLLTVLCIWEGILSLPCFLCSSMPPQVEHRHFFRLKVEELYLPKATHPHILGKGWEITTGWVRKSNSLNRISLSREMCLFYSAC